MKGYLLKSVVAFGAIATMMSCSKDVADAGYYEDVQKQNYVSNFIKKYGEIDANKSWDFTSGERQLATRGFTSIRTQVMEKGIDFGDVSKIVTVVKDSRWLYSEIQGGVEKNGDLLDAMITALPEKKSWTGKPAVLVAPSSGFWIYPLFSGGCLTFDLKVKVGDQEPVVVFSKDWINFQTINGMTKDNEYADGSVIDMKGIYIEAPVGTPVEVYIDNIYNHTPAAGSNNGRAYPSPAGTTNGRAVYVDISDGIVPEIDGVELKENTVVKYIGIEDIDPSATWESRDNDFNDVVLAVIGNPDVPQEKIITEDKYEVKTCKTKRFMIEDLGATDDFDFNDVVVDVEDYTVETHQVTRENGVIKTDVIISTSSAPSQAIIRAMGGTIDFELTIGTTTWVKSENGFDAGTMYNTQYNVDFNKELAVFEVTDWDYSANNIGIKVRNKDGLLYTIKFPKAGEAPMMIAVDPTQEWMGERISVPSSWFY